MSSPCAVPESALERSHVDRREQVTAQAAPRLPETGVWDPPGSAAGGGGPADGDGDGD